MTASPRFVLVLLFAGFCCVSCGDESVPTAPTSVISPTTVIFNTLIGAGGSASRSFVASQAGSVTVTLQSAAVPLGIGVGVPLATGGGCRAAASVMATPSDTPQLTIEVEEGTYCVLVFDVGGIVEQIPFALRLVYP